MPIRKNHTRKHSNSNKNKKGGDKTDIETGYPENFTAISAIPADPLRFDELDNKIRISSFSPTSKREVENVFSNPNPEEKQLLEKMSMFNEDTLNSDKGGTSRKRNRRSKSRKSKRSSRSRSSKRRRSSSSRK